MKNILEGNKIVVDLDDEQHNQVNSGKSHLLASKPYHTITSNFPPLVGTLLRLR